MPALFHGILNRRRYGALFLPDSAGASLFLRRICLRRRTAARSCGTGGAFPAGLLRRWPVRYGWSTPSCGAGICLLSFLCGGTFERCLRLADSHLPCCSCFGNRRPSCRVGRAATTDASNRCARGTCAASALEFACFFSAIIEIVRIDGYRAETSPAGSAGTVQGAAGETAAAPLRATRVAPAGTAANASRGFAAGECRSALSFAAAGNKGRCPACAGRNRGFSGGAVPAGRLGRRSPCAVSHAARRGGFRLLFLRRSGLLCCPLPPA